MNGSSHAKLVVRGVDGDRKECVLRRLPGGLCHELVACLPLDYTPTKNRETSSESAFSLIAHRRRRALKRKLHSITFRNRTIAR